MNRARGFLSLQVLLRAARGKQAKVKTPSVPARTDKKLQQAGNGALVTFFLTGHAPAVVLDGAFLGTGSTRGPVLEGCVRSYKVFGPSHPL